jgi:hypothetical protein
VWNRDREIRKRCGLILCHLFKPVPVVSMSLTKI